MLLGAFILAAREAFGSVGGFVTEIGLWSSAPASFWRFPLAAVTANATLSALWWYYFRSARRGAAVLAALGGLGLLVLLGAPRGYGLFAALLAIAGWWSLPDRIERAGGVVAGCAHGHHSHGP